MCRLIPAKYYFRVAGLGEIFARQKFLAVWYIVHVASLLCLHSVQGVWLILHPVAQLVLVWEETSSLPSVLGWRDSPSMERLSHHFRYSVSISLCLYTQCQTPTYPPSPMVCTCTCTCILHVQITYVHAIQVLFNHWKANLLVYTSFNFQMTYMYMYVHFISHLPLY